jgi:hypothetical protein
MAAKLPCPAHFNIVPPRKTICNEPFVCLNCIASANPANRALDNLEKQAKRQLIDYFNSKLDEMGAGEKVCKSLAEAYLKIASHLQKVAQEVSSAVDEFTLKLGTLVKELQSSLLSHLVNERSNITKEAGILNSNLATLRNPDIGLNQAIERIEAVALNSEAVYGHYCEKIASFNSPPVFRELVGVVETLFSEYQEEVEHVQKTQNELMEVQFNSLKTESTFVEQPSTRQVPIEGPPSNPRPEPKTIKGHWRVQPGTHHRSVSTNEIKRPMEVIAKPLAHPVTNAGRKTGLEKRPLQTKKPLEKRSTLPENKSITERKSMVSQRTPAFPIKKPQLSSVRTFEVEMLNDQMFEETDTFPEASPPPNLSYKEMRRMHQLKTHVPPHPNPRPVDLSPPSDEQSPFSRQASTPSLATDCPLPDSSNSSSHPLKGNFKVNSLKR